MSAETIKLREISLEQAKKEIFEFLSNNEGADYHDISVALKLDIDDVMKACKELEREVLIGEMNE
jgi:predicted transcriptional regulator